jgi:hypothetical protein
MEKKEKQEMGGDELAKVLKGLRVGRHDKARAAIGCEANGMRAPGSSGRRSIDASTTTDRTPVESFELRHASANLPSSSPPAPVLTATC